MPADQLNFGYFAYESDDGTTYALRANAAWGANALSGGAALAGGEPGYGRSSLNRHPRRATFQDPTTYRTFSGPVFTAAAFSALGSGDTVDVHVPGLTATVTYNFVSKSAEKVARTTVGRTAADHA
jgi:hypothetical protein